MHLRTSLDGYLRMALIPIPVAPTIPMTSTKEQHKINSHGQGLAAPGLRSA
jgi:hypothetical protein